jgi:hypothetical protein
MSVGPGPAVQPRKTNSMAVASLVLALVSWFLCGVVFSIVAIILGLTAREQIAETGENGRGMATFAIWMSYIHIAISIAVFVVVLVLVIRGARLPHLF